MPWLRRARLQAEWGFADLQMRDLVAADGVELVAATVQAGAPAGEARSWWTSYLGQQANVLGVSLDELPITPGQVAVVIGKVAAGELTTKLARQVVDGLLAGEGEPDEIIQARGLAVVSDDSALQAAVDQALAAQPAVAEKIRGGNLKAVGAIIGPVMKSTRGQADAARVRQLVLATLGVEG